jgi:hypothetical protein
MIADLSRIGIVFTIFESIAETLFCDVHLILAVPPWDRSLHSCTDACRDYLMPYDNVLENKRDQLALRPQKAGLALQMH